MLPVLKLNLDRFQLRDHPLLRSDPPDGEGSSLVALPTEVGEAQEREGLRFSLATLLSVSGCVTPELDQPCLFRMQFQSELCHPFLELLKEPFSVRSVLEAQHKISGVADNDHVPFRHFPAPDISPQVEGVM